MKAHVVVDVLRGQDGYKLVVPNLPNEMRAPFLRWMDGMADAIEGAQHFVFENMPIERDSDKEMTLPGLEQDEHDLFSEGLLPLPFQTCWFEAPAVAAPEYLCFLLRETESGFTVDSFRVIERPQRAVQFTGQVWHVTRSAPGLEPRVSTSDPFGGAALMNEYYRDAGLLLDPDTMIVSEVNFILYLLLMLCSRSTEFRTEPAPEKLNRSRRKKGKAPIPAHRIVSIIPRGVVRDYRAAEAEAAERGPRASPRIHWRRSHVRTLADGKRIAIGRTLVGYRRDPDRDQVTHDYRVRL